jgi:hypothetical protein
VPALAAWAPAGAHEADNRHGRGQHVSDDLTHACRQSARCVEAQNDRLRVLRIGGEKGVPDVLGRRGPDGFGDRD